VNAQTSVRDAGHGLTLIKRWFEPEADLIAGLEPYLQAVELLATTPVW
jgi:hypothetical protein